MGKKEAFNDFLFFLVFNQSCTFFGMDWCQLGEEFERGDSRFEPFTLQLNTLSYTGMIKFYSQTLSPVSV